MSKVTQHVVRSFDGWSVRRGGAKRATRTFETQEEAISFGRKISQNQGAELYIHKRNGMIREKRSYGNDPHPPYDEK